MAWSAARVPVSHHLAPAARAGRRRQGEAALALAVTGTPNAYSDPSTAGAGRRGASGREYPPASPGLTVRRPAVAGLAAPPCWAPAAGLLRIRR